MFATVKKKATKVGSTATVVRNSVLIISHITFRGYFHVNSSSLFCIYKCTFVFRVIDNRLDFAAIVITLVSKASKVSLFGDF